MPPPETLALIDTVDGADPTGEVQRLRKTGFDPETVRFVVEQARLRLKARAKFGAEADRMFFTQAGLEQATRATVADYHASRLVEAGMRSVADLGCGIGGDALAFARAGLDVFAVDADPETAALAELNGSPYPNARFACAEAQAVELDQFDAVWLDPARRTGGVRETRRVAAAEYSPPLEWVWQVAAQKPAAVKLGPAHDRDEVPADAETQWISADGSVVELVVYTGALARPGVRRAALVLRGDEAHELTGASDASDAPVAPLGAYLFEPDGAVIRARLIGLLAEQLGAGMLDEHIAYLTSDALIDTPFAQAFRVVDVLPADTKALARELKARGIGTLEIKKRGVDLDPATLRKQLKLAGPNSATLFLTRLGSGSSARRTAILAERV